MSRSGSCSPHFSTTTDRHYLHSFANQRFEHSEARFKKELNNPRTRMQISNQHLFCIRCNFLTPELVGSKAQRIPLFPRVSGTVHASRCTAHSSKPPNSTALTGECNTHRRQTQPNPQTPTRKREPFAIRIQDNENCSELNCVTYTPLIYTRSSMLLMCSADFFTDHSRK